MKLKNIFKKRTASTSSAAKKVNIEALDKKQLGKVIGGSESTGHAGKGHFGSTSSG